MQLYMSVFMITKPSLWWCYFLSPCMEPPSPGAPHTLLPVWSPTSDPRWLFLWSHGVSIKLVTFCVYWDILSRFEVQDVRYCSFPAKDQYLNCKSCIVGWFLIVGGTLFGCFSTWFEEKKLSTLALLPQWVLGSILSDGALSCGVSMFSFCLCGSSLGTYPIYTKCGSAASVLRPAPSGHSNWIYSDYSLVPDC